jgi:hypothetical protein
MKRVTAAAIVAAVSMAFAGQAWATAPELLSAAQLDAVVAGTAPDHDRHHGDKHHGKYDGKSDHGDKHHGKHDRGDRHHGKNDHGDKHHGKRDHGDKHYGKNDRGDKHYGKNDRGDQHHARNDHGKKYGKHDRGDSHGNKYASKSILSGNKVLSGNDVNVLSGNNTAVGVGILGTGAIALRK